MARPLIKLGSSGSDVLDAQLRLNLAGCSPQLRPGEEFGEEMKLAVEWFQRERGLGVDGQVGENTWRALDTLDGGRLLSALDLAGVERTRDSAREFLSAGDYVTAKALLEVEYAKSGLPPESRSTIAAGLAWAEHGLGNWDRARDLLLEADAIVSWFPSAMLTRRDFMHRLREIGLRQPPGPLPSHQNAENLP
jgi:hypothetical protein